MSNDKEVHDITSNLPTLENTTRTKVKTGATIGIIAAGVLLLADDLLKKFKSQKHVEVVVTDKPANDNS